MFGGGTDENGVSNCSKSCNQFCSGKVSHSLTITDLLELKWLPIKEQRECMGSLEISPKRHTRYELAEVPENRYTRAKMLFTLS